MLILISNFMRDKYAAEIKINSTNNKTGALTRWHVGKAKLRNGNCNQCTWGWKNSQYVI